MSEIYDIQVKLMELYSQYLFALKSPYYAISPVFIEVSSLDHIIYSPADLHCGKLRNK